MYPSRIIGYQDPLSWTFSKVLLEQSESLSSSINLVAKVQIFIKLLMYVLSHGCLLNSYKAFFHLHTWFFLSCVSTPTGCKCLSIVYDFFSWESSCYESCLVSHDVSIYYMMELWTSLYILILHPRHHSFWTGFPFLLGYFFMAGRFCINDVVVFIILFLNCHHLFFGTSLVLLCL